MLKRARKRDAPQGAVPCVFEIRLQGRETISLAQYSITLNINPQLRASRNV